MSEPAFAATSQPATKFRSLTAAIVAGVSVGALGGLIGLGGAEFRLPLLIAVFGFAALQAVIVNKAMSLIVVLTALPARLIAVPFSEVAAQWTIIANLLAGSLAGAWIGATWATKMRSATLYRILAVLLVVIAATLAAFHLNTVEPLALPPTIQLIAGLIAGALIGIVAAFMGVAGGELLIPTIVLLYGIDIKLAGSLSLAVSLPTMLVAFARYSQDASFQILSANKAFVLTMAAGSILGTLLGAALLTAIPSGAIVPALVLILLVSAATVWAHR